MSLYESDLDKLHHSRAGEIFNPVGFHQVDRSDVVAMSDEEERITAIPTAQIQQAQRLGIGFLSRKKILLNIPREGAGLRRGYLKRN